MNFFFFLFFLGLIIGSFLNVVRVSIAGYGNAFGMIFDEQGRELSRDRYLQIL